VSGETHVWAENYDRVAGDVLRLQCDVATAIAREIQIKLKCLNHQEGKRHGFKTPPLCIIETK